VANPINNKTVLRNLEKLAKDLNKKVSIRVGIIGDKAHQIHSDTNLTNADLGAIHEFGATINVTDKMRGWFWYNYGIHKSNKAINIPARSFLRMPLLSEEGKKEIMKFANEWISSDSELNKLAIDEKLFMTICESVAVAAHLRVLNAFDTGGFGNWTPITAFSANRRRGAADSAPLNDTGELRNSITYEVKEIK
jgi:phage gpG-like protein